MVQHLGLPNANGAETETPWLVASSMQLQDLPMLGTPNTDGQASRHDGSDLNFEQCHSRAFWLSSE